MQQSDWMGETAEVKSMPWILWQQHYQENLYGLSH